MQGMGRATAFKNQTLQNANIPTFNGPSHGGGNRWIFPKSVLKAWFLIEGQGLKRVKCGCPEGMGW